MHSYKDLTRHRIASFAIESTRWCDYSKESRFEGISFIEPYGLKENLSAYNIWKKACEQCEIDYKNAKNMNITTDQASQFLNQSLKADVVVTANIREWRHIFKLRTDKSVYPNLRFLMIDLLKYFKEKLPTFFEDIKVEDEVSKKKEPEQLSLLNLVKKEPEKINLKNGFVNLEKLDKNDINRIANDIAQKLFKYKREKDKIPTVNGVEAKNPIDIVHWIQAHSNRIEELKFITKVIEVDLFHNKTNRNYFQQVILLNTGNIEFVFWRKDCTVSIKKLKAYYEKYKTEFPNIKPTYLGQTIRFE